ncbi:hypothetical protein PCK1_001970 [Pneumocystis canis]|nr:hypothetical protein PCK1_001970 [Pneumocystis canis]
MPIRAVQYVSTSRNGMGAYIPQFCYCNWAGSSRGMNLFLRHMFEKFARSHPYIEMVVSRRPGKHPILRGLYTKQYFKVNGREKVICVRNLDPQQILKKAELLKNSSGAKLKRIKWPVFSLNTSVRGIWSPFHQQNTVSSPN